ncbi:MAG: YCF48-related protein [Bacteroidetes bacterium]|nr:YCF48-related protein [Bacteroidota bacterium]
MKNIFFLFLLFISTVVNISLSQTWSAQASGTSFDLRAVHFVNSSIGTAVGYSGTIRRTTDGGVTWSTQTSGTLTDFLGVHFIDVNTGWVVGGSGKIFSTTDGGATWSSQTSGLSTTIEDVFFTDASNGYAVGRDGKFLKTTDGGSTWSITTFNTGEWFQCISFSDANHGFAAGFYGRVLRIVNGVASLARSSFSNPHMYGVAAIDPSTAFICGASGTIQKTTDGGTTWISQTSGTTSTLFEIMFVDANNGIAVGSSGKIIATTNGGANWSTQTSGVAVDLWGVWCPDGSTGIVAGNGGTILRSTNISLPVELTSFTASAEQNNIELKWNTATEVNNFGFEVERRVKDDGHLRWFKAGFVEGNGTINTPKEYSFSDSKVNAGTYFYRLKQLDRDGKFSYSQEVEATITSIPKEFVLAQNYPNPFNPSTVISYQLPMTNHITLKVYDAIGREVATLVNEVKEAGSYSAHFDGSRLSSGIYFARLGSNGKQALMKMALMK